jgi:hypothetical protein
MICKMVWKVDFKMFISIVELVNNQSYLLAR